MKNEQYYIITEGIEVERIYGDQEPICLNTVEVIRLSAEWGVNLFEIMHEASTEEIEQYGTYDAWMVVDMTDAQKRASQKYKANKTKSIRLELNIEHDADIIARLDEVGNRQGYIKELVRRDMKLT